MEQATIAATFGDQLRRVQARQASSGSETEAFRRPPKRQVNAASHHSKIVVAMINYVPVKVTGQANTGVMRNSKPAPKCAPASVELPVTVGTIVGVPGGVPVTRGKGTLSEAALLRVDRLLIYNMPKVERDYCAPGFPITKDDLA
jgi:hypothetical protein